MPGNATSYRSARVFLPAFWRKTGIAAGQSTGLPMGIVGITKDTLPLVRKASIVSVGITLTTPVTAGLIRFELTKNGVGTGITKDITLADGTRKIWELDPGQLVGNKNDEVGFLWGSSGSLTPDGTIEAVIYVEVQWEE
jgi:hypothetical protein